MVKACTQAASGTRPASSAEHQRHVVQAPALPACRARGVHDRAGQRRQADPQRACAGEVERGEQQHDACRQHFQFDVERRLLAAAFFAQGVAGEDRRQHAALQHVQHDDRVERAAQAEAGEMGVGGEDAGVVDAIRCRQRQQDRQQQQVQPVRGARELRRQHQEGCGEEQDVDERRRQRRQPGRRPEGEAAGQPEDHEQGEALAADLLGAGPARQGGEHDAGDDGGGEAEQHLVAVPQAQRRADRGHVPGAEIRTQPGNGQQHRVEGAKKVKGAEGAGEEGGRHGGCPDSSA